MQTESFLEASEIPDTNKRHKMIPGSQYERGEWSINKKNKDNFSTNKLVLRLIKEHRDKNKLDSMNHSVYLLLHGEERVENLKDELEKKELELEHYRFINQDLTDARNMLAKRLLERRVKNLRVGVEKIIQSLSFDKIDNRVDLRIPQNVSAYRIEKMGSAGHVNCETVLGEYQKQTYVVTMELLSQLMIKLLDEHNGKGGK